jgi:MerR family transcriptional regulator, light-induced transcriptional regulator
MEPERILAGYVDAVVAGDRHRAFAEVENALRDGLSLRVLYLEVFQPALREVGRRWETGALSVAQEHLATAITQTAMSRLAAELFRRAPAGGPSVRAACVETERHDVGLRMLCDLLELEGWTTRFLGSTVPPPDLVRMAQEMHPDVIALSASLPPSLMAVRTLTSELRRLGPPAPLILVGGRPFLGHPELAAKIGADLTAQDAGEAVDHLKRRAG